MGGVCPAPTKLKKLLKPEVREQDKVPVLLKQ